MSDEVVNVEKAALARVQRMFDDCIVGMPLIQGVPAMQYLTDMWSRLTADRRSRPDGRWLLLLDRVEPQPDLEDWLLRDWQRTVMGYVESRYISLDGDRDTVVQLVFNEEGALLNMPFNPLATFVILSAYAASTMTKSISHVGPMALVGPVVVAWGKGEI